MHLMTILRCRGLIYKHCNQGTMAILLPLVLALPFFIVPDMTVKAQGYSSDRPSGRYTTRNTYCRELERELASDWVRGRRSGNAIPELNRKIRRQDALYNKLQNRADRMDCYENMFIFGRSLRRTRKCLAIDRKIRAARRKLARLQEEKRSITDSRRDGNRRKRIIDELARNNCGDQYRYEARRNSGNWFEESGLGELFGGSPRPRRRPDDNGIDTAIQPYATYRTMCVRLCDGYYFPVSFSTLPSSFARDGDICQNKCAAPAELFVYRNPGGEVEQMISPDGRPYDSLENAWRYRKEFIKGCSCKPTEYSRAEIDAHNNPGKQANNGSPSASSPPAAGPDSTKSKNKNNGNGLSTSRSTDSNSATTGKKARSDFDKIKTIDDLIR